MSVEKETLIPGRRIQLAFGVMVLVMVILLSGLAWVVGDVRDLGKQNKALILSIQASRVESCQGIYAGIRKVFQPFFPPAPRTQKQQDDLDKFNKVIVDLTKECVDDTKLKKKGE